MHAQDKETDKTRGRAGAGRPAARVPAPGPASGLLALQRAAGNAAVARAVEEQRHEHDANCGHGASVQRSAVHEVLRSPGQAMDGPLRNEMEGRFGGEDFSGVRLHTDSGALRSAAEIEAQAYTSFPHVVWDGRDKVVLAEELDHFRQQGRGPVPGTDNGDGLMISDPRDWAEIEAGENARRVMAGPAPEQTARGPVEGSGAAGPGASSVQRAVTSVQRKPSGRPTVHDPAGDWEAHQTPGRPDGALVLSGHGSWTKNTPDFRVPAGTKVHLYCQHGNTVLDSSGGLVETGGDIAPSSSRDGRHKVPDYTLHVPSGLDIHGSPVAVTPTGNGYQVQLDPTNPAAITVASLRDPQLAGRSITFTHDVQLSAILRPNMGDVHMAACRHLEIPGMQGRTRNQE
ncbi:DUF4157 domain-containing protein [Streptomyces sp. NPDC001820]|uniref:eCIS core domain-containing protein n=1 Tax=Streptomyces sp. NPDC001820 TaxID=3364613 RepID=UPI0036CAAB30